jgi:hypothetical protein
LLNSFLEVFTRFFDSINLTDHDLAILPIATLGSFLLASCPPKGQPPNLDVGEPDSVVQEGAPVEDGEPAASGLAVLKRLFLYAGRLYALTAKIYYRKS